jgi:hypothetical protein
MPNALDLATLGAQITTEKMVHNAMAMLTTCDVQKMLRLCSKPELKILVVHVMVVHVITSPAAIRTFMGPDVLLNCSLPMVR